VFSFIPTSYAESTVDSVQMRRLKPGGCGLDRSRVDMLASHLPLPPIPSLSSLMGMPTICIIRLGLNEKASRDADHSNPGAV